MNAVRKAILGALWGLTMASVAVAQQGGAGEDTDDFLDFLSAGESATESQEEATDATDYGAEPEAAPEVVAEEAKSESADVPTIPVEAVRDVAETPDTVLQAPSRRSRLIEEIVVTAQKREESVQDVPISVQAFSAERLDALGIADQNDLPRITPGLQVATQVAFTTVFMRGVGTDAFLTADPSVVTYIDGIYYPSATGLAQDFGMIERVEVLKGPQGTLFGRNATGGAISVVTQRPDFDAFSVSTQLGWASYPDFRSRVHVNLPLTDTFAASVSAVYNRTEHYVEALAAGEPLSDDKTEALRVRLRWAPADWMDFTLSGLLYSFDSPSVTFTPHQETTPLGRLLGTGPGQPPRQGALDTPNYNKLDNEVVYGELELFPGPFDVKLLGSHQDLRLDAWFDFDGSMMPLVSFRPPNNFAETVTAELQILSNDRGWGAERLKWIVGGYYFKSSAGFDPTIGYIAPLNLDLVIPQLGLPALLEGTLLALTAPLSRLTSNGLARTYLEGVIDSESASVFAEATLTLTDWLDVTAGVRYQSEERVLAKSTVGAVLPGQDPLAGERQHLIDWQFARDSDGNRVGLSDTTTALNPKLVISLRPTQDDLLIYLSAQRASKSSTYNAIAITARPTLVRPEKITAYEIGLKDSWFGGLTQLSASLFWYEIEDLQVQYFALLNGGIVTFENVPEARSRGAELEFATSLFPSLTEGLVLSAGVAYVDAIYTNFPNGSGFQEPLYVFRGNLDLSGNRMVRTPKVMANATLGKTWYLSRGSLELAGDVYYNSGFFLEGTNVSRSEQEAYVDLGARVSYLHEPWRLRVTAFGRNLTDELYVQGGLPNDFGNALFYAPPRSYGLRLDWEFGS